MGKFLISVYAVLFSLNVHAAVISTAFGVRTVYSTTNVTTGAWVELVAKTEAGISGLSIFDSCGKTLELGVGVMGSEVRQILIFPGGNGGPLSIPPGSRVSIRAVSGNCTAANTENDINFFYN